MSIQRDQRFAKLARFLKKKRLERNLSQYEIAKLLDYESSQYVSNWERGICSPPLNSLAALIEILGIKKDELIKMLLEVAKADMEAAIKMSGRKR